MSEAVREAVKAAIEQVRCAGNPMWEADEAFTREFVAENIADAALTAIAKAGFAVVPRELSEAQAIRVFDTAHFPDRTEDLGLDGLQAIYAAMIAAGGVG